MANKQTEYKWQGKQLLYQQLLTSSKKNEERGAQNLCLLMLSLSLFWRESLFLLVFELQNISKQSVRILRQVKPEV